MPAKQLESIKCAMTIEAEVIELVARHGGLSPEKVSTTSRLFHDLGFDGDDAVELFEAFQERFDVELTPLYEHWSSHFGPEGCGSPKGLLLSLALMLVPPLALMPFDVSPMWGWTAALAGVVGWMIVRRIWPIEDDTVPIAVKDLVIAAETKSWPIRYSA